MQKDVHRTIHSLHSLARNPFGVIVVLLLCIAASWMTALQAAPRSWSTTIANDQVNAADCTECGDDIGILIECRGDDQPALVTVHWAAVENGQEGAVLPIQFKIEHQVFSYQATTRYYGQIGYTPEFKLEPNDPLIEALSAGKTVIVTYAGANSEISLRGSRRSLESFSSHCGWAS